jgi:flagellar basal body L-ring protein FlgH
MKVKTFISCFFLILFTSCANFVDAIHKDLEMQEDMNREVDTGDNFNQFRHPKRKTSSVYNKVDRTVTTGNEKTLAPSVKRQYKSEKEVAKRLTASDLTDNGSDGSLWSGSDPNGFLFSTNKSKSSGDIVQISVLPHLKNEITMELKKAFPDNPYETKANANTTPETKAADPKAPNAVPEKPSEKREIASEPANTDSTPDKISGVIVEEINREHLLIRGRKNVLFKNRKRMIEVQALVSRKDIGENDQISSDAILESNITVVK